MGKAVLRNANVVSSISSSFLNWCYEFSGRSVSKDGLVVPLTVKNDTYPRRMRKNRKNALMSKGVNLNDGQPKFCFVGSLSAAFDFGPIFEAAEQFESKEIEVQFLICGDGDEANKLKKRAAHLRNVVFLGWVEKEDIETLYSEVCASLAPYKNTTDFTKSIPNKIIDSLANGAPILTSLEGEVKELIEGQYAGFFYSSSDELSKFCAHMIENKADSCAMRKNAKNCYQEYFDFDKTYSKLAGALELKSKEIDG